jgi:hypothetical protein
MKKNKNKIIIGGLILAFSALIFVKVFQMNNSRYIPPPFSSPYVGGGRVGVLPPVNTFPQSNDLSFTNDIPGEITVYDFISKLKVEGKINFTKKNYIGMGEFIDSINGIKNNQNQSWIYYVNGVEAQVGVSNYKIKIGDIVSWKYEKSNF